MENNNDNNQNNDKSFATKLGDFVEDAAEKTSAFAKTAAEKTKGFAKDAYGKTKEFANETIEKAKDMAEIGKLNAKLKADRDSVDANYTELGRLIYHNKKDMADGDAKLVCDALDSLMEDIKDTEALIAEIKADSDKQQDK